MSCLAGHAALITGSTKGVGRAIAEAYAAAGADVVLHGRSESTEAKDALAACRSHGIQASFVAADLSEPQAACVPKLAADARKACPQLDILVNNAGHYFDVPFAQMTLERFNKTIDLNVTSGYFLTQEFARHWIANGVHGRVLLVGSINGRRAKADSTAYDISKGAVEMMVKTLCVALAPQSIRVNGLAPGLVRTPQTAWLDDRKTAAAWLAQHTPNGEIPPAQVCGEDAVFLVSDGDSHVQGQMLMIDGGMSIWQQPPPPTET